MKKEEFVITGNEHVRYLRSLRRIENMQIEHITLSVNGGAKLPMTGDDTENTGDQ